MIEYYPGLRFKEGEYSAAGRLADDIKTYVHPRFIVPPPKEIDPEQGRLLSADELAHLTGERLSRHWPLLPGFLDLQYFADKLGDIGVKRLFKVAQNRNPKLAPVARVQDLSNPVFREAICSTAPKLGIHIPYEQFDKIELGSGLKAAKIDAGDCVIFLDFTGMPYELEGAAESVASIFDDVSTVARCAKIVYQASAFPKKNRALAGKELISPRHEWSIFHKAIAECSVDPRIIGYGDFGADCGEIKFPKKKGGGPPIRHVRYATSQSTVTFRGAESGSQNEVMTEVANRIVKSEYYRGQDFSYADDEIWKLANRLRTAGNPSTWREWNMAHHMTLVVRDLGLLTGIQFAKGRITKKEDQAMLAL